MLWDLNKLQYLEIYLFENKFGLYEIQEFK